jgi:hypothetical protein
MKAFQAMCSAAIVSPYPNICGIPVSRGFQLLASSASIIIAPSFSKQLDAVCQLPSLGSLI